MAEELISKAIKGLNELNLDKNKRYGLAFSAGPDSTFLLHVLKEAGFNDLVLLYVNYHDSPYVDKEEALVRSDAEKYLVELDEVHTHIQGQVNFESEARNYRYEFFAQISKAENLYGIFTAHQEDDVLITYLMQKLRGGIVDYYGIKNKNTINDTLILRPLLDISKKDLTDYLISHSIPFYDDITNQNLNRTRNYLRESVLPTLDKKSTHEQINKDNAELNHRRETFKEYIVKAASYSAYYKMPEEVKLDFLYNYIKAKLTPYSSEDIIASRNLAYQNLKKKNATSKTSLLNDLVLYRNYDSFYVIKSIPEGNYSYKIPSKGSYVFSKLSIDLEDEKLFNIKPTDYPLTIRNVKKDDEFSTNIINKSVSHFIKSQKVPSYLRKHYPVILNKEDKIICVPFYKDVKDGTLPLELIGYIL